MTQRAISSSLDNEERTRIATQSVDKLKALASSENLSSEVLYTHPLGFFELEKHDGKFRYDPVTQDLWETLYEAVRTSVLPGATQLSLPPLDNLSAGKDCSTSKVVPVTILDVGLHKPNRRTLAAWRRAMKGNTPIDLSGKLDDWLSQESLFTSCALLPARFEHFTLLPYEHRGCAVDFKLDSSLFFSNRHQTLPEVTIDFSEGAGERRVAWDKIISIRYSEAGKVTIKVRCQWDDDTYHSAFHFSLADYKDAPPPDETWDLVGKEYKGEEGKGTAFVYLGSEDGTKHTDLIKPAIVADGFPGHSLDWLYGRFNKFNFLTDLLAEGYDIIFLTYEEGDTYVQRNAYVFVECVETAIAKRQGEIPLVCGGGSMGGLIARYALAYMATNGMEYHTSLYLSFDTPHKGANLPVSVQYFMRQLKELGHLPSGQKKQLKLLDSPAAKQMLYYFVSLGEEEALVSQEYLDLQSELQSLGSYPPVQKVAIANGSDAGDKYIEDNALAVNWYGNICANGEALALPGEQPDKWIEVANMNIAPGAYSFKVKGTFNVDGSPGGLAEYWEDLADGLEKSGYGWVENPEAYNCFVPSISSIDVGGDDMDPVQYIAPVSADTPFDRYYIAGSDRDHATITAGIKYCVMAELGLDLCITGGSISRRNFLKPNDPPVTSSWGGDQGDLILWEFGASGAFIVSSYLRVAVRRSLDPADELVIGGEFRFTVDEEVHKLFQWGDRSGKENLASEGNSVNDEFGDGLGQLYLYTKPLSEVGDGVGSIVGGLAVADRSDEPKARYRWGSIQGPETIVSQIGESTYQQSFYLERESTNRELG